VERFHRPALSNSAAWSVTAACDTLPERRAWAAGAFPEAAVFETAQQLLANGGLDAALIASPVSAQAELAIVCLRHGLHVLVEKPAGLNLEQARRMQRAAQEADRLLWVGYNRKSKPAVHALRTALGGDQIQSIHSWLAYSLNSWDPVAGLDPASLGEALVLYDVAVHQLDLIPWLTGRAIQSVKVGLITGGAGAGSAQFTLLLDGGLQAVCLARHSDNPQDTVAIDAGTGRWLAHASGLLRSRRLSQGTLRRAAAAQHWVHRKLIRLGLKADQLATSYRRQLEAFAEEIRGQAEQPGWVSLAGPVPVHAALQALMLGTRSPGVWIEVIPDSEGLGRRADG
jgi:predicted dehydrogenase